MEDKKGTSLKNSSHFLLLSNNYVNQNLKPLSRKIRYLVFIIFCFMHSFLSISVGVLSSSILQIKKDLQINDNQFGIIGTSLGLGNIIGSILYTFLSDKISRKLIVIVAMTLCSGTHLFFFLTNNYYFVLGIRFLSGIGQVCGYPYFQSWPDQFGIQKYKTLLTTIIGLSGNVGFVWGYLINIVFSSSQWKFGLLLETMAMGICIGILCFIPSYYLNNTYYFYSNSNKDTKNKNENEIEEDSIFAPQNEIKVTENEENNSKDKDKAKDKEEKGLMLSLLTNIEYILMIIFKSDVYFINIAQVFWYSDYLINSLGVSNPSHIFLSYSINIIIGNALGMLTSGFLVSCLGGYNHLNCVKLMLITQILASIFGIISSYFSDCFNFTLFNTIFNFFFGAVSTFCIVVGIRTIPNKYKGGASGFFILVCQITAFLPATLVYSAIKTYFNDGKYAMRFVMYYSIISVVALFFENLFRNKKENEIKEKNHKDNKDIPLQDIQLN